MCSVFAYGTAGLEQPTTSLLECLMRSSDYHWKLIGCRLSGRGGWYSGAIIWTRPQEGANIIHWALWSRLAYTLHGRHLQRSQYKFYKQWFKLITILFGIGISHVFILGNNLNIGGNYEERKFCKTKREILLPAPCFEYQPCLVYTETSHKRKIHIPHSCWIGLCQVVKYNRYE